ncbi:alpha/beta fold hydrolase [Natronospirillum operosum]|uniref:Alpha/beta fold hydrolase n=1 Tax=Natronospirillum operosum TaxID=2759953 RepID=A0A4Z0W6Z7_9GAMM|nr:alpha/beta fold hydrolase [Natronospirillum operosum]TGG91115.1 alpha/beta fold hydrolase [Natronospirillum operosum]
MELYYRTQGDLGEPLLIIHGLFGDGLNWGGVSRLLRDDFHLILPDMRNHGRSPHDDNDCSYPAMAADVLALMDRLELDQVQLVGHSMGGKIAMALALQHPHRVQGLTVVDIAPKKYPVRHRDVFAGLQAVAEARPESRQEAEALLRPHIETTAVRTFILKNLERTDTGFDWRVNWRALYERYDELADFPAFDTAYEGPCQFLVGGDSDYVTRDDQAEISRLFPQARGRVVGGAGHWLHAEKPELVARWIQDFVEAG